MLVAVRLPSSDEISAPAGPRRIATGGERWYLKFQLRVRENGLTTVCCHLRVWSAGPGNHLGNLVVLVGARPVEAELVMQTFQTEIPMALRPLADSHPR